MSKLFYDPADIMAKLVAYYDRLPPRYKSKVRRWWDNHARWWSPFVGLWDYPHNYPSEGEPSMLMLGAPWEALPRDERAMATLWWRRWKELD